MKRQPTPAEIVILVSGLIILIAGFFPFFDDGGFSENVFGSFAFPIATFVWLFGIILAVLVGLPLISDAKLPEQLLGFTLTQVKVVLGFYAALTMIGWLLTSDSPGTGVGFVLMLLAAIGLLVGTVMDARSKAAL